MANKNGILKDTSGNEIYPVTYTHNVYDSNSESLDNILAGKVGFTETSLGGTSVDPLASYYDKNTIDNSLANKANKSLDNVSTILNQSTVSLNGLTGIKKTGFHYCIESWVSNDNSQWYRIYNDGFKECGGILSPSTSTIVTVKFPITFGNLPAVTVSFAYASDGQAYYQFVCPRNVTTTSFGINPYNAGQGSMWHAEGY